MFQYLKKNSLIITLPLLIQDALYGSPNTKNSVKATFNKQIYVTKKKILLFLMFENHIYSSSTFYFKFYIARGLWISLFMVAVLL